jgi:hypothetical protein
MLGNLPYCCFSFGGGVQSSAIYLMLIHEPWVLLELMGELPDKVYFADTGAETSSTYKCLEHMQNYKSQSFGIEVVSSGNMLERQYTSGDYNPLYPFFISQPDGKVGMAKRQCTSEYKVRTIQRACREAFGLVKKHLKTPTISTWLGISTDELERLKFTEGEGFVLRYPLIELGWDRNQCIDYCATHNWVPIKSRCYMCPYQSDKNWLDLKINHPDDFEKACVEDERIRDTTTWSGGTSQAYLHRSCVPLREVVFKDEPELFLDECQGMCGN